MADPDLSALDDNDLNWGPSLRSVLVDISRRADGQTTRAVITAGGNLIAAHAGCVIYLDLTADADIFVPPNVFAPDQSFTLINRGVGIATLRQGSGVTINVEGKTAPYPLAGQYAWVTVTCDTSTNFFASGQFA